ncbi:unnamed protein product [marine sediment metagenome]|uniref:Uncharacterized protein n=1 Tax=marine sediment metagenome TaxID=412755 RepID=X0T0M4_9ZZZZ
MLKKKLNKTHYKKMANKLNKKDIIVISICVLINIFMIASTGYIYITQRLSFTFFVSIIGTTGWSIVNKILFAFVSGDEQ